MYLVIGVPTLSLLTLTSGLAGRLLAASSRKTFREVDGIFDLWPGLQTCGRGERRGVEKAREFSRGLMRDGQN